MGQHKDIFETIPTPSLTSPPKGVGKCKDKGIFFLRFTICSCRFVEKLCCYRFVSALLLTDKTLRDSQNTQPHALKKKKAKKHVVPWKSEASFQKSLHDSSEIKHIWERFKHNYTEMSQGAKSERQTLRQDVKKYDENN